MVLDEVSISPRYMGQLFAFANFYCGVKSGNLQTLRKFLLFESIWQEVFAKVRDIAEDDFVNFILPRRKKTIFYNIFSLRNRYVRSHVINKGRRKINCGEETEVSVKTEKSESETRKRVNVRRSSRIKTRVASSLGETTNSKEEDSRSRKKRKTFDNKRRIKKELEQLIFESSEKEEEAFQLRVKPFLKDEQPDYCERSEFDILRVNLEMQKNDLDPHTLKWVLAPNSVYFKKQWKWAIVPEKISIRCPCCNVRERGRIGFKKKFHGPQLFSNILDHLFKVHERDCSYEVKKLIQSEVCRECGCLLVKDHFSTYNPKHRCSTWMRFYYYKTRYPQLSSTQIDILIKEDQKALLLELIYKHGNDRLKNALSELRKVDNICRPHPLLDRSVFEYPRDEMLPVCINDILSLGVNSEFVSSVEYQRSMQMKIECCMKGPGSVYIGVNSSLHDWFDVATILPLMLAAFLLELDVTHADKPIFVQSIPSEIFPALKRYEFVPLQNIMKELSSNITSSSLKIEFMKKNEQQLGYERITVKQQQRIVSHFMDDLEARILKKVKGEKVSFVFNLEPTSVYCDKP